MLTVFLDTQKEILKRLTNYYFKPENSVLDLTFGTGKIWRSCKNLYKVTSVDKAEALKGKVDYNCDFTELVFPSYSFDGVVYDPPYKYGAKAFSAVSRDKWGTEKSRWTVKERDRQFAFVNMKVVDWIKPGGYLLTKIMDTGLKGQLIGTHAVFILALSRWRLTEIFVYIKMLGGLFNTPKPQKHHGYWIIFQKPVNQQLKFADVV